MRCQAAGCERENDRPLRDEKDAVARLARPFVGLDDAGLGTLSPNGDVLVHDYASLSMRCVGHADRMAGQRIRVIDRRLDGGEVTPVRAHNHGVAVGQGLGRR